MSPGPAENRPERVSRPNHGVDGFDPRRALALPDAPRNADELESWLVELRLAEAKRG